MGRGFDEAVQKIFAKPLLDTKSPQKAVLLEVVLKHVFAINAAAANFTCEFEVRSSFEGISVSFWVSLGLESRVEAEK